MAELDIAKIRKFLAELAENNTRDWFTAEKPRYEALLRDPAQALLDALTGPLEALTGQAITPKLFRPQRDVRFSKDKTPYHLHLHLAWTIKAAPAPAFFYGLSLGYSRAGAGLMGFDKAGIDAWRAEIDGNGPAWTALQSDLSAQGFEIDPPALKRVPAPYDKDHPQGALLRHKGYAAWTDQSSASVDALLAAFTALWPLNAVLIEALG